MNMECTFFFYGAVFHPIHNPHVTCNVWAIYPRKEIKLSTYWQLSWMNGTSKCPQVSSAIVTVNIYYDELTTRGFNNQLRVSEIETSSHLFLFPIRFKYTCINTWNIINCSSRWAMQPPSTWWTCNTVDCSSAAWSDHSLVHTIVPTATFWRS